MKTSTKKGPGVAKVRAPYATRITETNPGAIGPVVVGAPSARPAPRTIYIMDEAHPTGYPRGDGKGGTLPPGVVVHGLKDSGARTTTPVPVFMSEDSATRKLMPVASGVLGYFPDALLLVSFVSRAGNDKHNPGQPLHWAKEKSTDEPDCEVRHMLDYLRGLPADPGLEPLGHLAHLASKAWRALAHLQRACDAERAKAGRQ